jgi:hypothetical protein
MLAQCIIIKIGHDYMEFAENYNKVKKTKQNKEQSICIDGRPKVSKNTMGFINNSHLESMNKQPNCMFERHYENQVVVCAIKPIPAREELFINYHLNRIKEKTNYGLQCKSLLILSCIFYSINILVKGVAS